MKFKIMGIEKGLSHNLQRFMGFRLEGISGSVDPFVDDNLIVDCLGKYLNDEGQPINIKEFFAAEMEWAENQIGKKLICDELAYVAFATTGPVSFQDNG